MHAVIGGQGGIYYRFLAVFQQDFVCNSGDVVGADG